MSRGVKHRVGRLFASLHPAWVGLLACGLYAPTIAYGFTRYDDPWLIRDNVLLQQLSTESVWRVLTDFSWEQRYRLGAEYLPVRDLSVMTDYAVYGDWVGGLHLTQVLLYAGTCAVLAALTLALFQSRPLAWLVGALFATHPVHVEAVAWLSERKGVLGALLLSSSLLLATSFLRRGARRYAITACMLFPLAIGAKAVTIAGAGALLLIVLWLDSPLASRTKAGFVCAYAACGLIAFTPYVWVARRFGVIAPDAGEGIVDKLLLFSQVHGQYLKLMAFGGPYAIEYGIEPFGAGLADWLPGALLAAGGAALVAWALVRRSARTAVTFGIGWWLVFLAPVSHLFATVQNFVADRYVFLSSYGLVLAVAALLLRLPWLLSRSLSAAAVLIGCAWTLIQMPTWSSSERLFANAVHVAPQNASAWDKLAVLAVESGKPELAWQYTRQGLAHSPNHWRLIHRQALLLEAEGKLDAAIDRMTQAATVPESHRAYANLALLYLRRGRRNAALQMAEQAVQLQPTTEHNQRVLGIVAYELHDRARACRAFERAWALDPYDEQNIHNLELCGRAPTSEAEP